MGSHVIRTSQPTGTSRCSRRREIMESLRNWRRRSFVALDGRLAHKPVRLVRPVMGFCNDGTGGCPGPLSKRPALRRGVGRSFLVTISPAPRRYDRRRQPASVSLQRPRWRFSHYGLDSTDILITMSSFSEKGLLGELEQLVLLAVVHSGAEPHAPAIREAIAERTGIELARGTVYVSLERLNRKGYLTSRFGEPTAARGGKAKRLFAITRDGLAALAEAERVIGLMRRGATTQRSG